MHDLSLAEGLNMFLSKKLIYPLILLVGFSSLANTSIRVNCAKFGCEIDNKIQPRELLDAELEVVQTHAKSIIEELLKHKIDQVGNLSLNVFKMN